jgi:hypothetical protein
MRATHTL